MELKKDVSHGTWDYPFEVHHTRQNNGLSLYPHVHKELEFTIITQGEGRFFINNQEYYVKKGDILFIPSESIHLATPTDSRDAAFFSIVFAPECFCISDKSRIYADYIAPVLGNMISFKEHLDSTTPWHQQALSIATKIEASYQLPQGELLCQSSLLKLWHLYFTHSLPGNSVPDTGSIRLKPTIDYMHTHFAEHILVRDLAQIANMSEGHYSRTFKKYMKISPLDYLLQLRIQESAKLLQTSTLTISEIALSCGFNDFSYFGKCFRVIFGCSPREYRKNGHLPLFSGK